MTLPALSDEAQAFLLELQSCAGTLPRSAILEYCAIDADHRSTPCPLLDAYCETANWRDHLGMDWDDWLARPVALRADWLWRHLLFCFFRVNVYDVDLRDRALLIAGGGPTSWLVPNITSRSFAESDYPGLPFYRQWRRAPDPLSDLFRFAPRFRRGHPFTFAQYSSQCSRDQKVPTL